MARQVVELGVVPGMPIRQRVELPCTGCSLPVATVAGDNAPVCPNCHQERVASRARREAERAAADQEEKAMRADRARREWMERVTTTSRANLVCSNCTETNTWSIIEQVGGKRCRCGTWINEPPLTDDEKLNRVFAYQAAKVASVINETRARGGLVIDKF